MMDVLRDTSLSSPKLGNEALFAWCIELLEYGRHQDKNHSIRFSRTDLTLEAQEQNYSFEGDVKVTFTGLTGYTLESSAFPAGTSIKGYTGSSGDTLHISIPEKYEESSFSLYASGIYDSTEAVLFFYAPTTYGQQCVVSRTIDIHPGDPSRLLPPRFSTILPRRGRRRPSRASSLFPLPVRLPDSF